MGKSNKGYVFNVVEQTENCINWIKDWFNNYSGNAKGVIIGISGGKDSTVAAKLLCEAIGSEKVFGVMMPNGEQKDIDDSKRICELLKIKYTTLNIQESYKGIINSIESSEFKKLNFKSINLNAHTLTNISPRLRMTTLYTIGQELEIIKNRWKINMHKRNIHVPNYNSEISICIN